MACILEGKEETKDMRKLIYICDRCKKEKDYDTIKILNCENDEIDLCQECYEKAYELIRAWADEPEQNPEPEPTKPEKATRKAKKAVAAPTKSKKEIDAGTAQALRDNGWTITKIAEELGCSKSEVHRITHKPAEKRRFVNEWAEHEPDLNTSIRIEMGEKHLDEG